MKIFGITSEGDVVISGSLTVTGSYIGTINTASYALTASYAENAGGSGAGFPFTGSAEITGSLIVTGSVNASSITSSFYGNLSGTVTTASFVTASNVIGTVDSASNSITASYVNTLNQNVTVSGSLTITTDLTVLGSSSIQYITSSQLNIADNIITVNALTPSLRYGGLSVVDSGSSPIVSGSLLFDSQNNQWVFVHQSAPSAAITSSVLLMGPQTFDNVGNETALTSNRIPKASGADLGEHLSDSNITDNGSIVSINSNTEITGSLTVTGSVTASFFTGDGSGLTGIGTTERRSDYTGSVDPNINLLYLGYAAVGTSEATPAWTISQLSISSSGATVTRVTSSAAWSDRYAYTYL